MKKITLEISKRITIPDPVKVSRYRHSPELGPALLFFSGGSALRKLSRCLINYTHNSVHIITPFDSGGSSAKIRKAFSMLGIGDMRARLIDLADRSVKGNHEIYRLFAYRLPCDREQEGLFRELLSIEQGRHDLIVQIREPMQRIIRNHLHFFIKNMPPDFDLAGASIGNLIIAGGYLNSRRYIESVIFTFSKLVEVKGIVKPVLTGDMHLEAVLENGDVITEQHNMTGKEVPAINQKIRSIHIIENNRRVRPSIARGVRRLIQKAEVIVYPFGSFYTSIIANLLPDGISEEISDNRCAKVYIPNRSGDPEMYGMTTQESIEILISYLAGKSGKVTDYLNIVLIDTENCEYDGEIDIIKLNNIGIQVIDTCLITDESRPDFDENNIKDVLLSLT